ncbi:hypothetical protein ABZ172_14270 [Streptomyces sp. NPDC006296]|uniref:hypothetical protein n=1 Tax=Streptomyces sp. NPDC006296 TaxID=3156746 RepID=UPI0033A090E5
MTQSGQGDERQLPAVRPAHEGVVLPAEGGPPWHAGSPAGGQPEQTTPAGGQPWGQPWGPQGGHQDGPPPGQLPPEHYPQDAYRQPQHEPYPQQHYAPQQDAYRQDPYQHQSFAQPLPPEAGPAGGTGQGGDADATQYIAPVPGGMPPERAAESTRYLGHDAAPAPQSDADATQYIPPVPGGAPYGIRPGAPGDRQPPAEFDNLFRSDEPAGATQQMPRFAGQQQPQGAPAHRPAPQAPQGGHGGHGGHGRQAPDQGGDAPRRRSAAVPLIAAVVVGCAVIGLGAGALMSGGDDTPDDKKTVAAQSPTAGSPQEEADPAKPQAEELDKLLADSNSSRSAVISAVEKIKSCRELDQAATDLKGAAEQRRSLVTRLEALSVDKLPDHAALKSSLTQAWQASAEADDHYAAWAVQAKHGKKVCKGGKARTTDETAKANASSGEATTAKQKASGLWNSLAQKYGLTERAPTQL